MSVPSKRTLVAASLLVGLTASAVLAIASVELTQSDQVSHAQDAPRFDDSLLLTSNRDVLSVCVDSAADSTIGSEDLDMVRTVPGDRLADVSDIYQRAEEYAASAEVVAGCPPRVADLTAGAFEVALLSEKHTDIVGEPTSVRFPDAPSRHRIHLYLTPDETYADAFGTKRFARGAAEYFCTGSSCGQVTTELYIPLGAAVDVLGDGLIAILGLSPERQAPTDSPDFAEKAERLRESLRQAGISDAEIDALLAKVCEVARPACE